MKSKPTVALLGGMGTNRASAGPASSAARKLITEPLSPVDVVRSMTGGNQVHVKHNSKVGEAWQRIQVAKTELSDAIEAYAEVIDAELCKPRD